MRRREVRSCCRRDGKGERERESESESNDEREEAPSSSITSTDDLRASSSEVPRTQGPAFEASLEVYIDADARWGSSSCSKCMATGRVAQRPAGGTGARHSGARESWQGSSRGGQSSSSLPPHPECPKLSFQQSRLRPPLLSLHPTAQKEIMSKREERSSRRRVRLSVDEVCTCRTFGVQKPRSTLR